MIGDALPPLVVMGVSASGKSSVGARVGALLGIPFIDGDDLHPASNVAKMAAGIPLDDDDRWPWLDAVAARLAEGPAVVACSALKRAYRDRLRASVPDIVFVHLTGDPAVLARRMGARYDHFMPESLLQSQLDTLEDLGPDEKGFALDFAAPVDELAERVVERLQ